jgi:hypothetical protein
MHFAEPIIIGTGRTMPPRTALALVQGTHHGWAAKTHRSGPPEASVLDEAQTRLG